MTLRPCVARAALALGVLGGCTLLAVSAGSALAAERTITFRELTNGSTFNFVDNVPHTTIRSDGFPEKVSVGDEFVETAPLGSEGKRIGTVKIICTATKAVSGARFGKAGYLCNGTFVFADGTLVGSAASNGTEMGTEGAIVGGTGVYAGARGTFYSAEGKGSSSLVTVTLIE